MKKKSKLIMGIMGAMLFVAGCSTGGSSSVGTLSGKIVIDGSSTVAPITEAVLEEFQGVEPNIEVSMGISGTGGGFKKFVIGDTQISNASRKITSEEQQKAEANGISYYELAVARDAITVVTHHDNTWAESLTSAQLKEIWRKDSPISKWSDIDPSWPNEAIKLYGPDTDSGTFDYFHEAIVGKDVEMRSDYTASTDDNVLVTGIQGDKYSLGYFGYVYYLENAERINAIKVDGVLPNDETINNGTYKPLSRKIFIYVNQVAYEEDEAVHAFVNYYLDEVPMLAPELGFPALSAEEYDEVRSQLMSE